MKSKLMDRIHEKKINQGDYLADVVVDLCFVTSYKIEELITMPPSRLNQLIERFKFHFVKEDGKK